MCFEGMTESTTRHKAFGLTIQTFLPSNMREAPSPPVTDTAQSLFDSGSRALNPVPWP